MKDLFKLKSIKLEIKPKELVKGAIGITLGVITVGIINKLFK